MTPAVHPLRYPTLYMYMAKLPAGLASYPQAQTLADMALSARARWPDLADRPDLPEEVRTALMAPWRSGEWIAETVFMAYTALVRDVIYREDDGYLKYCHDTASESFTSPWMRAIMHFVSPSLLVMSSGKRWAQVKRGTALKTLRSEKNALVAQLTYPPNIYHTCMLKGFAQSFLAGLECTQAKSCAVDTKVVSDKECHFDVRWSFER